jgi:hypothetical protein
MARPPDDERDRLEVALLLHFQKHVGLSANGWKRLEDARARIRSREEPILCGFKPFQAKSPFETYREEFRQMYDEVYRDLGPPPDWAKYQYPWRYM